MISFRLLAIVAAVWIASPLAAQQRARVPSAIACAGCRIELRRVATLRGDTAGLVLADAIMVDRDSRGIWYAASAGGTHVGVFDSSGRLTRVLGGRGQGPGEFGAIDPIVVGPGDTLLVYDHDAMRRTVFSPTHSFVRTERLPARWRGVGVLPDGRQVIAADIRTDGRGGHPLHRLGTSSVIERSFGADPRVDPAARASEVTRFIATDPAGTTWSTPLREHRVEAFDSSGRRMAEYTFSPNWWNGEAGGGLPRSGGLMVTATDPQTLWIVHLVTDAARRGSTARGGASGDRPANRVTQASVDSTYDLIVEAFDVSSGRVLASRRFAELWRGATGRGLLTAIRILPDGVVEVDVLQPVLIRPTGA